MRKNAINSEVYNKGILINGRTLEEWAKFTEKEREQIAIEYKKQILKGQKNG